jgi:hypothetical protein
VKLQRSGTPRAVEFPEEWNSRRVELPGEWNSQGVELSGRWNSQGVELSRAKFQLLGSPSTRRLERKSEIPTAGEPLRANSNCWRAPQSAIPTAGEPLRANSNCWRAPKPKFHLLGTSWTRRFERKFYYRYIWLCMLCLYACHRSHLAQSHRTVFAPPCVVTQHDKGVMSSITTGAFGVHACQAFFR